jgi:hypothetical protein
MTPFGKLSLDEQEMLVSDGAKQYWAALNRGSFSLGPSPDPLAPLKVILALARADAEDAEYSDLELNAIRLRLSGETGQ